MSTPAARRQIRHPHTQFTGVDGLGPLPSPGPGSTLGNRGGGSGSGGGSSPGQSASRRLSKTRPPANGYFGSKSTPSSPLSSSTGGPGPSRESVDEYNQLLRQANYAANHYDSVYGNSTSASGLVGNGWNSSSSGSGGGLLSSTSTSSKSSGTLGHDHARSKTPDGRSVTSNGGSYHHRPYFDRSRVIAEDPTGQRTASMVAAPPSATPSRPSRNNTANLHDNPFDLSYSTSTTTATHDAGSSNGNSSTNNIANLANLAKRQRRMSLPSGSSGSAAAAAAHDSQFVADPHEMIAPGPSDQSNPYGTLSQSSFSGMRSRSGTQSQKSKKSMLSFMSGASSYALRSLAHRSHRFELSPACGGGGCRAMRLPACPAPTRSSPLVSMNDMLILFLFSSRLPHAHQTS